MRRAEKAERIGAQLDALYPETPVPLDHRDPYTLLIAVLLSAQSTDKKVNEITPSLFDAAATPSEMVALGQPAVLRYVRQIGLAPTKSKNIVRLSEQLLALHDGDVPASFEALEALPGVGHKTASVVMSQAFGVPAFAVDTHIHRLAARWGLSTGKNVKKTEHDLKAVFSRDTWTKRHLQIIFFGREYCPARGHDLSTCPICSWSATKKRMALERKLGGAPR